MNQRILRSGLGLLLIAILAAACSSGGATASPSQAAPSVAPSTASEAPSEAPSEAASEAPPAAGATVEAVELRDIGMALIDGKTKFTVYIFTKDVKDSGKSACTGGCLETWPALTVAAGETPTAGAGVTGTLGTITREDDGTLQVTYNGLPLYFFKNDQAPGDTNGVYENWEAVKP
jgi:predicted lipoprotein with Yx(FWY)xxD motif